MNSAERTTIEQSFLASRARDGRRARWRQLALGLVGVLLFLAVWEVLPRVMPGVNVKMFPPPSDTVRELYAMVLGTGEIWPHIGASLRRALLGFVLGASLGVLIGVVTGRSATLRHLSDPLLHGFRAIPSIAIVPLAIVWFGLGDLSKVMLIAWGTFFPVWVNTFIGMRDLPPIYLRSAASLGASNMQQLFLVGLPAALPFVFAGLRQATAVAFVVLVAAELVGAEQGLGYLISFAHLVFRVDIMFVGLIALGAIGFAADQLFAGLLHKLFPWYGGESRR